MATLALASGPSFRGEVKLRCTGATPGLQCLVSPESITFLPSQIRGATVAVATQGSSTYNLRSDVTARPSRMWGSIAGATGLFCFFFFIPRAARRSSLPVFVAAAMLSFAGCGGGAAQKLAVTPLGRTELRITASSVSTVQTQVLTITVQRP